MSGKEFPDSLLRAVVATSGRHAIPDAEVDGDSVHLRPFPTVDPALRDEALERDVATARSVVTLALTLRERERIGVRRPLRSLTVASPDAATRSAVEAFAEAHRWYGDYLQSFPEDGDTPPIHYRWADLLLEHGDFKEAALAYELRDRGLGVQRQVAIPVRYRNVIIDQGFRADLVVEAKMIVELKSVERVAPVQPKQLLTHLRLADLRLGLLLNFNVALLRDGIKRVVNGLEE